MNAGIRCHANADSTGQSYWPRGLKRVILLVCNLEVMEEDGQCTYITATTPSSTVDAELVDYHTERPSFIVYRFC